MSKRRKRFWRILGVAVLLLLIVVVALPVWFPWWLAPAGRSFGLSYECYERRGYAGFCLQNVVVRTGAGTFRAERVEGLQPSAWLQRLVFKRPDGNYLAVRSWEYAPGPGTNQAPVTPSVHDSFVRATSALRKLNRWAPRIALTNGVVRLNEATLEVPFANWNNGRLQAELSLPDRTPVSLSATVPSSRSADVDAAADALSARVSLSARADSDGLRVSGTGWWTTNRVEFAARFGSQGMQPEEARIDAPAFEIPPEVHRAQQYGPLSGSLRARWDGARFNVDLSGRAEPDTGRLPPLLAEIHAEGDTNTVRIASAEIRTPGVELSLTEATEVRLAPPFLSGPTTMDVAVDLSAQTLVPARGHVEGRMVVAPGAGAYPRVAFAFEGSELSFTNAQLAWVQLNGELEWPRLVLRQIEARAADATELTGSGAFDASARTLHDVQVNVSGPAGNAFLPEGYAFSNAMVSLRVNGELSGPEHAGEAVVEGVSTRFTKALDLTASWKGKGWRIDEGQFVARAGTSELEGRLSAILGGATNEVAVSGLTLAKGGNRLLALDQPFRVLWRRSDGALRNGPEFSLGRIRWTGEQRSLDAEADIQWPGQGRFALEAVRLDRGVVDDFITLPEGDFAVRRLAVEGGWTNGPVVFALTNASELVAAGGYLFECTAAARGDANGIVLERFAVTSGQRGVAHAEGTLPLTIEPAGEWVRFHPEGALVFRASTDRASALWGELAGLTGVLLSNPALNIDVQGTWSAPKGIVEMEVGQVQWTRAPQKLPAIERFHLHAELSREAVRVSDLEVRAEGQLIQARADVPMDESAWEALVLQRRWPDWKTVNARLEIARADIAPFAEYLPQFLSPEGGLSLNLALASGGELSGDIALHNARTRPLESVGPIRDIEARATISGSAVELRNFSGSVGGQLVNITGKARLNDPPWDLSRMPAFELHLAGTNVPLARRPDVVLRADLDVSITNDADRTPRVTGRVRLRDSFYLSELADLTSGGVTTPRRRPPFFSIEEQPWARWELDVTVQGDRFLRVRSPLFRGIVSIALKLEGTLENPVALGEARVNSGMVTFPFGSLDVQQGFVSLASDDPYRPRLLVNASAERLGYDIKMEVTGRADNPVVQFSSSPPLTSEEILLMLTTGQRPRALAAVSTQQRAQGLALFVGKNLLTDLGFGGTGEQRLSIRSGEHLTETGRSTYEVEYRFNDDWSLLGEYDRFGQYNLGLKWRVYSR
ncbi:MAG TPA: hypothetical protein GYA07_15850 [Verrucomicrobia bacterium]|nr:hypothetical protein [Verrucomicrobiota bacterium]